MLGYSTTLRSMSQIRASYNMDFKSLFAINQASAFFVTRAKSNTKFKSQYSNTDDKVATNIICDQSGVLPLLCVSQDYPIQLYCAVLSSRTKQASISCFWKTTLLWSQSWLPACIASAGRWICSSSGLSSICVLKRSTAHAPRTALRRRFGSSFALICQLQLPWNAWVCTIVSRNSYKYWA